MKANKKILVVAESIDVEDSSGSKANVALIMNLRDEGYKVTVFHYTRKNIQLEGIQCIMIKEKKFNFFYLLSRAQRKIQHGFKINLAKYLESSFGFSFTFFNDVSSINKALKDSFNENFDLILTLSKGASFRPHYAVLQLPELHNKWMAYIHDPYPFHYYPEPFTWSEPGYRHKVNFFKQLSNRSKWAAFPSLLLKEWMTGFFPAFDNKSLIIPHQLRKEKVSLEIPEYFKEDKFVLLHAGNILKQRQPIALIKGFKKFMQKNPDATDECQLLLLGMAPDYKEEIKRYEIQLDQLYFSDGYVEYKEVMAIQYQSSVNIILESTADESPFLPGKFPHCIAAGKPILLLGPPKSESRRLLGKEYPYWSEANDAEKIADLIEVLYLQWKDHKYLTLNRKDLETYLSKENLSKELSKILF